MLELPRYLRHPAAWLAGADERRVAIVSPADASEARPAPCPAIAAALEPFSSSSGGGGVRLFGRARLRTVSADGRARGEVWSGSRDARVRGGRGGRGGRGRGGRGGLLGAHCGGGTRGLAAVLGLHGRHGPPAPAPPRAAAAARALRRARGAAAAVQVNEVEWFRACEWHAALTLSPPSPVLSGHAASLTPY